MGYAEDLRDSADSDDGPDCEYIRPYAPAI
jgi:hypothetical protein